VLALGIFVAAITSLALFVMVEIWPAVEAATATNPTRTIQINVASFGFAATPSVVMLLLVLLMGALGSSIYGIRALVTHVGKGDFEASWSSWYLLTPLVGAGLALVVYFTLLGGLLGGSANTAVINPYGIAATAGLTGLFSRNALDKLAEVFDALFGESKRDTPRDK
jgi:hypothetical protein